MSRIGKKVIAVPKGVTVTIRATRELEVKGPKGTLRTPIPEGITFKHEDGQLQAERASDDLARRPRPGARAGEQRHRRRDRGLHAADGRGRRRLQGRRAGRARSSSRSATRTRSSSRCPKASTSRRERVAAKASHPAVPDDADALRHRQAEARPGRRRDAPPAQARPLQGQGRALRRRAAQAASRARRESKVSEFSLAVLCRRITPC